MTSWANLISELMLWDEAGLTAELWWRDDDAIDDTLALHRLLQVADAPVCLAVIPQPLQSRLVGVISSTFNTGKIAVLQHGLSHSNHEPSDRKKAELGAARPVDIVIQDLAKGWDILFRAFPDQALPVLTPPWNRIASDVVLNLPQIGFRGISTYLARRAAEPVRGLRQVNTHVDLVDWHKGGGFVGETAALGLLIGHLRAKRLGRADPAEPTGLLTHHLVQDEASWQFLMRLQDCLSAHPVIRWLQGHDIWGNNPGSKMPDKDNRD